MNQYQPWHDPQCAICRLRKSLHSSRRNDGHSFILLEAMRPVGCACEDLSSWADGMNIPTPCASFAPYEDDDTMCKTCEHDKACHGTPQACSHPNSAGFNFCPDCGKPSP